MDEAKNVSASFATPYSITATANPTAGGATACTPNTVPSGGNSICTATANPGYIFAVWSGDCTGTICSLSNVTTQSVSRRLSWLTPVPA